MAESIDRRAPWRVRLHEIIFEADTPTGKGFDVALLVVIVVSVAAVMLESVTPIHKGYGPVLRAAEWVFTVIFTVEYVLRLMVMRRARGYVLSFFGIVDLLAVLPTYLSLLFPGAQSFLVLRVLRLLRVFRVLKLARFVVGAVELKRALRASWHKIAVFLTAVLTIVLVLGTVMHFIEGEASGFTNIPLSVYWAVVTMTTVGYGDITPDTPIGRFVAACIMILGYGIIAVPTGIVTAELTSLGRRDITTQSCPSCAREGHDVGARFCKHCGTELNP